MSSSGAMTRDGANSAMTAALTEHTPATKNARSNIVSSSTNSPSTGPAPRPLNTATEK